MGANHKRKKNRGLNGAVAQIIPPMIIHSIAEGGGEAHGCIVNLLRGAYVPLDFS